MSYIFLYISLLMYNVMFHLLPSGVFILSLSFVVKLYWFVSYVYSHHVLYWSYILLTYKPFGTSMVCLYISSHTCSHQIMSLSIHNIILNNFPYSRKYVLHFVQSHIVFYIPHMSCLP